MKTTPFRRLWALVAAIAMVTLTSFVALLQPATAADNPLPDGSQKGTLHITKATTPTGAAGDGTQVTLPSSNKPIAGVTFTIKQVKTIDLTTQQGWKDAGTLATTYNGENHTTIGTAESDVTGAKDNTGSNYTLTTAGTATTAADGTVTFPNLPLGVYLVEETATPSGVTPSAPYLVTLPITDPSSTSKWNYDVYTYPKNAVTTAGKTVNDQADTGEGSILTYTITGDIPDATDPKTDKVSGYIVSDNLDKKLTYVPTATVTLTNGGPTLTSGTDYTLSTGTDSLGGTYVVVTFTQAGLDKLTANRADQVVVTIQAKVNTVGQISNTAYVYPDQAAVTQRNNATNPTDPPGSPSGPSTSGSNPPAGSNTPLTDWGGITVEKLSQSGTDLPGATFQVYRTKSKDVKPAVGTDTPVSINGVSSWTTGDGTNGTTRGQVDITGLRYSAFDNGAPVSDPGASGTDNGYNYYWLVETKAPSGYELQAEPIGFTVDQGTTGAGVDTKVTDVTQNAGFQLPFTGGTGSTMVYLVGAVIVCAAAAVAVGRRRRDHA